jgi:MFS transporter, DHA1 family, multidrug resistance protein
VYTFTVYIGSSLYTSSEKGVMEEFNVCPVAASLGLALYVLACQSDPTFHFGVNIY